MPRTENAEQSNSLEYFVSENSAAARDGVAAAGLTTGLGLLLKGSAETTASQALGIATSTLPSALSFGGLAYGLSLMANARSPEGRLAGLAITGAAAIPSYMAVTQTAPVVISKLYVGAAALAKGSYLAAAPYVAAVAAGVYLGYRLLKGFFGVLKRVFRRYVGREIENQNNINREGARSERAL
ncbi:MAG: hypothetical protein ABIH92_03785 [Nanoarchaeota archaeon]